MPRGFFKWVLQTHKHIIQVLLPVSSNTGISSSPATLQLKLVRTLFLLMEKLKSGSPEKNAYLHFINYIV